MWKNFLRVSEQVRIVGGSVTIEWAHRCMYHRLAATRKFVSANNMTYCAVSGCAVGLKSIQPVTLNHPLCKM